MFFDILPNVGYVSNSYNVFASLMLVQEKGHDVLTVQNRMNLFFLLKDESSFVLNCIPESHTACNTRLDTVSEIIWLRNFPSGTRMLLFTIRKHFYSYAIIISRNK
jgi:hypothetical protein